MPVIKLDIDLVHYGDDEYMSNKFEPIKDVPYRNKPKGGLWTSPLDCKWGWKDWCITENFGNIEKYFVIRFTGTVFKIDSYQDAMELPWIEQGSTHFLVFQPLVLMGIDAVYLTENGEDETRFSDPKSLYGWDCETVLVMNPECINIESKAA